MCIATVPYYLSAQSDYDLVNQGWKKNLKRGNTYTRESDESPAEPTFAHEFTHITLSTSTRT